MLQVSLTPPLEKEVNLFNGRIFSYNDAHFHRLGPNKNQLPINCPFRSRAFNTQRDGVASYNNQGERIFPLFFIKDISIQEPLSITIPIVSMDLRRSNVLRSFQIRYQTMKGVNIEESSWKIVGDRIAAGDYLNFDQPRVFREKVSRIFFCEESSIMNTHSDSLWGGSKESCCKYRRWMSLCTPFYHWSTHSKLREG